MSEIIIDKVFPALITEERKDMIENVLISTLSHDATEEEVLEALKQHKLQLHIYGSCKGTKAEINELIRQLEIIRDCEDIVQN